jgi:hypothetical protein
VRRLLLIAPLDKVLWVATLVSLGVVATLLAGSCAAEEQTPVEKAEEEAGIEEVVEPSPEEEVEEEASVEEIADPLSPEEIQANGCPEGQVANEAGKKCTDLIDGMHPMEKQVADMQAREQIRRYEAGELGTEEARHVECQAAKAYLDGGQERVDEIAGPVFERAEQAAESAVDKEGTVPPPPEGPDLRTAFAEAGYDCEEPAAPPSPADLDKKYEKPAADPKALEIQCGPQSNASPAFREQYC